MHSSVRRFAAFSAWVALSVSAPVLAADQPLTIFHAFDQTFSALQDSVCELGKQGYSHVQIPPAQRSAKPHEPETKDEWFYRYQPIDFSTIEGRGTEAQLRSLIAKAHSCKVKVIADVVFNHMTSDSNFSSLDKFPGLQSGDFHEKKHIEYHDGNVTTEIVGWLNDDLPDLKQEHESVRTVEKNH